MKQFVKAQYEAPSTEVLEVSMESSLLIVSEVKRKDYGTANESDGTIQEWD